MEYCSPDIIANDALLTVPDANLAVFSILMSKAFNSWNRTVSGRLKSDMRISQEITYNNFPLRALSGDEKANLEKMGQTILDARAKFEDATLADLYGPTSMPLELLRAHQVNDRAVLKLFGLKADASHDIILTKLFESYDEMTSGVLEQTIVNGHRKSKAI